MPEVEEGCGIEITHRGFSASNVYGFLNAYRAAITVNAVLGASAYRLNQNRMRVAGVCQRQMVTSLTLRNNDSKDCGRRSIGAVVSDNFDPFAH